MFRHIGQDDAGVSAPEYAILLLLLVASLILAMGALNGATTDLFTNAANGMSDAAGSSVSPSSTSNPAPSTSPTKSPPSPSTNGHGRSDTSPGHRMHDQGPAAGSPGASGFAPGHSK